MHLFHIQNKCTGKDNAMKKKLPVGIDNFEEIIREDFYYVDKTCLMHYEQQVLIRKKDDFDSIPDNEER